MANKETKKPAAKTSSSKPAKTAKPCACPYCDTEVEKDSAVCKPCGIVVRCPSCKAVVEPEDKTCRRCGKSLK